MIKLTEHAEEAIEKRKIALDWIDRAIAIPDFTGSDPSDPYEAIDEAGGKILRVVHRPDADDIVIVTVHFDRDARA